MRIAIADLKQESNSFSPVQGDWPHFETSGYLLRGSEIPERLGGTACEIGGALEAAGARPGVRALPLLAAGTGASAGPMKRPVFDALLNETLDRLEVSLPVDGVYMSMHGAMVAEGIDDATGTALRAIREKIGPGIPMVVSCDLHANTTRAMVEASDALVGYQTFPHVDLDRAGRRAMEILLDTVAGTCRPRTALCRLPMILPGENGGTVEGPMAELILRVVALEKRPGVLSASAFSVQPWLDLPDVGCSVVVVSDGDGPLARSAAEELADAFWERRERFEVTRPPLTETLRRVLRSERRPFILSDGPDAPSSGSTGDSTEVLRALVEMGFDRTALVNVVDPEATARAIQAGVGATISLSVGGRLAPGIYTPLTLTGNVRTISDGRFVHRAEGYRGVEFRRGRTAVLQSGSIYVVMMEQPVLQWDPEFYDSLGLNPREAQLVAVKSPTGFRAAYAPFAAEIVVPDIRGIASPSLRQLPWQRIGRPIHPLDAPDSWRTPPIGGGYLRA